MKSLLWIFFAFVAIPLTGQELVHGSVLDPGTGEPVRFAHVTNYHTDFGTITNADGYFRIPANTGDTIVFSSVGYQTLGWVVDEDWLTNGKVLKLPQDTTMLQDVVIHRIPPEEIFKQRILDYQPEDTSFWYHGMPLPKPYDNSPLSERVINHPVFVITHPTDFLYYKFSKQEKEKRKYYKITQQQHRKQQVYRKFTREWVGEVTQLKGDELTDFIAYCDYSLDYLEKTPKYIIQEDLLAKLVKFKKDQKG